ncbi:hypothetical protein [Streptomyces sp. NPDC091299]|uniref:DUF6197 family protein n=1 Tax=Streptomyces sp. NPDC091299 TaxID=3155302 RepID=UPI00341C22BA
MVTPTVTRSRIAEVLGAAADLLDAEGWDPLRKPIVTAIDQAAGFVPGKGSPDAEQLTLDAWDQLATHLDVPSVALWEREIGRTPLQVHAALHGAAAKAVTW